MSAVNSPVYAPYPAADQMFCTATFTSGEIVSKTEERCNEVGDTKTSMFLYKPSVAPWL